MSNRPVLIDESDGPCEICKSWNDKKYIQEGKSTRYRCDECGEIISPFNPVVDPRGCHSVKPHHYHIRGIGPGGVPGRVGIHSELCLDCYVTNRMSIYDFETEEEIREKCQNH